VHRRGFRFVAKMSAVPPGAQAAPDLGEPSASATLFVGRAAELQLLDACLKRACGGRRQIVFVTGEPGVGKTTLVEAFLGGVRSGKPGLAGGGLPPLIAYGCSVEQRGAREAYLPVLAALEDLARQLEGSLLLPLLRRFAPTWLAQVPWLLDAAGAENLGSSLLGVRPERMQREFCAFAEALAAEQPVCLFLEDLHWSDPATTELLFMLAQRHEPARLIVIGTYRGAEAAVHEHPLVQAKRTLQQRRLCVEIPVHSLTPGDVEEYLRRRLPGCAGVPELARLVYAHSDGTPLFVTAVVDELIVRGWLVDTEPGWALAVPAAKVDLRVPEDVREMIAAQLDAVKPADRSLLEAASTAGVEFTAHVVAAALESGLDDAEAACDRLSRLERFVRVHGSSEWPGSGPVKRYRFLHALHRQVVYESIPQGRCRRLHQGIGEALESAFGERAPEAAAELAHHFEIARDAPRAVEYLCAAAAADQRRFADREAMAYLERALEIVPRLPDAPARRRGELAVRAPLASVLGSLHGYAADAARSNYERVRVLCEEAGSAGDLYQSLYTLWHSQAARAEPEAADTARRMTELARKIGDAEMIAQAAVVLGRTHFWQGEFRAACDVLEATSDFWKGQPGRLEGAALLEPPGIAVHFYQSVSSWFLGRPDRAREALREAMAVAVEAPYPFVLAGSSLHAAYISHLWRDVCEVENQAERTLRLAEEHGFPFWTGMALALHGWALVQRGEAERGAQSIRDGIARHRAGGAQTICSHMLAFLADACLRLGKIEAGLEAVDEGLALSRSSFDRVYEPELWRLKGELLARTVMRAANVAKKKRGPSQTADRDAEACFRRGLEAARARQARSAELRAATSLARLWSRRGRSDEARTLLAEAYGWFTEGLDTPDLQEAAALLSELGAAVPAQSGASRRGGSRFERSRRRAR